VVLNQKNSELFVYEDWPVFNDLAFLTKWYLSLDSPHLWMFFPLHHLQDHQLTRHFDSVDQIPVTQILSHCDWFLRYIPPLALLRHLASFLYCILKYRQLVDPGFEWSRLRHRWMIGSSYIAQSFLRLA